jgi:hypothetical protein
MGRNLQNVALAREAPETKRVFPDALEENFGAPHCFDRLTETDKQALNANRTRLAFKHGEVLFRRGSPHAGTYMIRNGRIRTFLSHGAATKLLLPTGHHIILSVVQKPSAAARLSGLV